MRYSLKDLMLSVTLIAIGLACLIIDWRTKQVPVVPDGFVLVLVILLPFASVALISAGIGALVQKKLVFASVAVVAFSIFASFSDFWPWILNLL